MQGYLTPQDAAMVGFPVEYCRVVASCVSGDDAYVLLDTGSAGRPYLYGVNCHRHLGEWLEGSSSNGGGWSLTDAEHDLGTWSLWGEAPVGADYVRAELDSDAVECPVRNGAYLVAWFRRVSLVEPRITAFRFDGVWVSAEGWASESRSEGLFSDMDDAD